MEIEPTVSGTKVPDPNASFIFRPNGNLFFISLCFRNGSSIRDTALRAERGQPVAARRFFGREFNSIPALCEDKRIRSEVSNGPRAQNFYPKISETQTSRCILPGRPACHRL